MDVRRWWAIASSAIDDGIFVVDLTWDGPWGTWDMLRADAFALLGRIAEHTTHVRQQTFEDRVGSEMATGTLAAQTPFAQHGHLVRLRIRTAD